MSVRIPKVLSKNGQPVTFRSALVPLYVRRTKTLEAGLPWLYLKGVSSGEMGSALKVLLGPDAAGLSATTVSRLKRDWANEYGDWREAALDDEPLAALLHQQLTAGIHVANPAWELAFMNKFIAPIYCTKDWPEYNKALKDLGSLTICFNPEVTWKVAPTGTQRRQPHNSDAAIQACLTLKVLFGMPSRQTTGFVESLLKLVNLDWDVLDFSTLCRRQKTLPAALPVPRLQRPPEPSYR
jgi:hypothetical protein